MRMFKAKTAVSAKAFVFFITALTLVGAITLTVLMAGQINASTAKEGLELTTRAIRRAVVSCYAAEGFYPENIDYLTENYGLTIDGRRYMVFYQCFASNMPPEITVLERTQ